MKNLLKACLSLLLISTISPVFAQAKKKPLRWQDSIQATWVLDSSFQLAGEGVWEKNEGQDAEARIHFYPNGVIMIWRTGQEMEPEIPVLGRYELLQGDERRYLKLAPSTYWVVERLGENLTIQTSQDYTSIRLCLSKRAIELPDMKSHLAGEYNSVQPDPGDSFNGYVSPVLLALDTNGRMKHGFGEGDTGTWKLTSDMVLELNGTKKQFRFLFNQFQQGSLELRPYGAGPDSLVKLMARMDDVMSEQMRMYEEMEAQMDTSAYQTYDEVAPPDEEMPPYIEMNPLCQTWKAQNTEISLAFFQDGSVIYQDGKKKYKGTWSQTAYHTNAYGEMAVKLVFDGREQIAWGYITENYERGGWFLDMSFVPPKQKALKEMIFTAGDTNGEESH